MSKKTIIIIVAAVVLLGIAYSMGSSNSASGSGSTVSQPVQTQQAVQTQPAQQVTQQQQPLQQVAQPQSVPQKSEPDYMEITPTKLFAAFEDNEAAANMKYNGNLIQITGTISDIGTDILGDPYLSFETDLLQGVTCYFKKYDMEEIAQVKKGQKVTVRGTCDGKLVYVLLKNCELVK